MLGPGASKRGAPGPGPGARGPSDGPGDGAGDKGGVREGCVFGFFSLFGAPAIARLSFFWLAEQASDLLVLAWHARELERSKITRQAWRLKKLFVQSLAKLGDSSCEESPCGGGVAKVAGNPKASSTSPGPLVLGWARSLKNSSSGPQATIQNTQLPELAGKLTEAYGSPSASTASLYNVTLTTNARLGAAIIHNSPTHGLRELTEKVRPPSEARTACSGVCSQRGSDVWRKLNGSHRPTYHKVGNASMRRHHRSNTSSERLALVEEAAAAAAIVLPMVLPRQRRPGHA